MGKLLADPSVTPPEPENLPNPVKGKLPVFPVFEKLSTKGAKIQDHRPREGSV